MCRAAHPQKHSGPREMYRRKVPSERDVKLCLQFLVCVHDVDELRTFLMTKR